MRVTLQDSFRTRVFLAPVALLLTLDAGRFEAVEYNPRTKAVRAVLAPADESTPRARLLVKTTAPGRPEYRLAGATIDGGAATIPLGDRETRIELSSVDPARNSVQH
ncbi:hypothetical protein EON77_15150 [bacterium]|nr:MAG: hypothetical protein EON77_15150 [bacterium]